VGATMPSSRHPYRWMVTPEGVRAPIDADMAPLVEALWALGIQTSSCCQQSCCGRCGRRHRRLEPKLEHFGGTWHVVSRSKPPKACRDMCYVSFTTMADGQCFLRLVYCRGDANDLRDAMEGCGDRRYRWIWSVSVDDTGARRANPELYPVLVMPRKHLPLLIARAQERVEKRKKGR
jgi:hypothetical protein